MSTHPKGLFPHFADRKIQVQLDKKSINIPTTPSEAVNALPKPLMNNEIVVNRVEADDTASPIQKAFFQKDMTPGKTSHFYSYLSPNLAKETPEVEEIAEEASEKQEELAAKKDSERNIPQNPVTPGPTAMKGLFAEENKVSFAYRTFSYSSFRRRDIRLHISLL